MTFYCVSLVCYFACYIITLLELSPSSSPRESKLLNPLAFLGFSHVGCSKSNGNSGIKYTIFQIYNVFSSSNTVLPLLLSVFLARTAFRCTSLPLEFDFELEFQVRSRTIQSHCESTVVTGTMVHRVR